MSTASNIEWTDTTWNPVVGCTKVSEGCRNCYAVKMTHRLASHPNERVREHYAGLTVLNGRGDRHFNGVVRCHDDALAEPLRWRQPRRVFVNSMADLFHKDVPFDFIDRVFAVMALCPQHIFQILTKRPERMAEYLSDTGSVGHRVYQQITAWLDAGGGVPGAFLSDEQWDRAHELAATSTTGGPRYEFVAWKWPLPNVWLLASVENQDAADERIPHLLRCPAAVRGLSCEPLLGAVDLTDWLFCDECRGGQNRGWRQDYQSWEAGSSEWQRCYHADSLNWVIVGGESGPGARPMHPDWARSIRDQCDDAGVQFFFKQMTDRNGRKIPFDDFPVDLKVREWPHAAG